MQHDSKPPPPSSPKRKSRQSGRYCVIWSPSPGSGTAFVQPSLLSNSFKCPLTFSLLSLSSGSPSQSIDKNTGVRRNNKLQGGNTTYLCTVLYTSTKKSRILPNHPIAHQQPKKEKKEPTPDRGSCLPVPRRMPDLHRI